MNRDKGILDLIKATKELEDIDINQLQKILALTKMVQEIEKRSSNEINSPSYPA